MGVYIIMSEKALDNFGEILIREVRDKTIMNWKKMLDGRMKGNTAQQVIEKLDCFTDQQIKILEWMLCKFADNQLHNLLFMLEENSNIDLTIDESGKKQNIRELSDGLAGELYTEDGWIARFSKEEHF